MSMKEIPYIILLIILTACHQKDKAPAIVTSSLTQPVVTELKYLYDIPPPKGYKRIVGDPDSFENWMRKLPLKKDRTVYLFNNNVKPNQSAQFAVIDMPRSNTDLQQCADVVMRLRAEYLFEQKRFDAIRFMDYNKKWYNWKGGENRKQFEQYLKHVFGWCGSASLDKQLDAVENYMELKTGDVFIKGGFPGHAIIVADMAVNSKGEKIFMLIQGYQPAQDIHIVVNPMDRELSPWYKLTSSNEIYTPEWTFYKSQLHQW